MQNRRRFLNRMLGLSTALLASSFYDSVAGKELMQALEQASARATPELVRDEAFWHTIKQAYTVSPTILNLNNGGVSPQPRVVQEAVERYNRLSNEAPSYYMWRILDAGREPLRERLAEIAGCAAEELAINRNASEALETVIFGLRLQAGDEVVLSRQDYPNMINAWKQRAQRDGIVLKWVDLVLPQEDEAALVKSYTDAFNARTKVVHLTHMINWCGQVLPVKAIAAEAKRSQIKVLVDAAHTFAHLQYNISDLGCDYWGSSLHKWLSAPFGSGLLYVKKENISSLYPLFAAADPNSDDIRKFENLGTRSFAIEQGIGQAIDFYLMIGAERKQARLQYLKNYWAKAVQDIPGVSIGTSLQPDFGCAIGLLQMANKPPKEVANELFRKHKIHTVAIEWENISGVRITPNVYTLTHDLDRLIQAVRDMA